MMPHKTCRLSSAPIATLMLASLALTLGCEKTVPLQLNLIEPADQQSQALNGVQTLRVDYRPLDPSTGLPDTNAENGDGKAFLVGGGDSSGLTFSLEDEVFITVKGFIGDFEENPAVLNQLPDAIGRSVPVRPSQGDVAQLEVTLPVGILDSFGQTTTRDDEGNTSQTEMDNGVAVAGRHGHTATYLPTIGKVLIVGGAVWTDANGASPELPQCKEFDGVLKCFTILQSVELYDPATGLFETLTNSAGEPLLQNARAYHSATPLLDGRVLIMGGFSFFTQGNQAPRLDTLVNGFIFDPENIETDPISDPLLLTARRAMHIAVPINDQGNAGQVAIIGGCHGEGCSPFGSVADSSASVPDPVDRVPNVVELFDVESSSSTAVSLDDDFAARIARVGHQATRMGDFIIVSGGHDSEDTKCNIEILEVQLGTLVQPSMYPDEGRRSLIDCPTGHTQVTIADNTVAIIGGLLEAPGGVPADSIAPSSLVQFWTTTNGFQESSTVEMLSGRAYHHSALLQDGSILNVGGRIPLGGTAAERLDQAVAGSYAAAALSLPLDESRMDMGVVTMPNNQVLITGGYAPTAGVSTARADIYFGD